MHSHSSLEMPRWCLFPRRWLSTQISRIYGKHIHAQYGNLAYLVPWIPSCWLWIGAGSKGESAHDEALPTFSLKTSAPAAGHPCYEKSSSNQATASAPSRVTRNSPTHLIAIYPSIDPSMSLSLSLSTYVCRDVCMYAYMCVFYLPQKPSSAIAGAQLWLHLLLKRCRSRSCRSSQSAASSRGPPAASEPAASSGRAWASGCLVKPNTIRSDTPQHIRTK